MFKELYKKLRGKVDQWLTDEPPSDSIIPYDFNRLKHEVKPGDVLLIEGKSRVSKVIRSMTQSPWTHAALYIGRLVDIEDEELQNIIRQYAGNDIKDNTRFIIEDLLDRGTVITSINFYEQQHIRICRPIGITPSDLNQVLTYAIKSLGQPYNVRHLLDLARFLLPWSIMPRRWRSSLFRTSTGEPESGICSSLIAEAFASVQFPVLPYIKAHDQQGLEVFQRNSYLFTPKDFDYSPFFEIIKYPLFNPDEPLPYYRRLPWTKSGMMHQDYGMLTAPPPRKEKTAEKKKLAEKKDETTPQKE